MAGRIEKIKKQMRLFTPDEEIARITHEIGTIGKINIRTDSIDGIYKKYTWLNPLKTMRNELITNTINTKASSENYSAYHITLISTSLI